MLESIERLCRASRMRIEEVDSRHRDWGGGLRNRLIAIGEQDLYVGGQRIPSHAVHGTWADLLFHHLEETPEGFKPHPEFAPVDSRLLEPVCIIALRAAVEYCSTFFGDLPEIRPLYARIDDVKQRIRSVGDAHEEWIQKRRSTAGPGADPGDVG